MVRIMSFIFLFIFHFARLNLEPNPEGSRNMISMWPVLMAIFYFLHFCRKRQWRIQGEAPPPTAQNFLNVMLFFGNFDKIICWRPRRVGAPPTGNPVSTPERGDFPFVSLDLLLIFSFRTYVQSNWCMKEFQDAHAHATGNGRKKFLIPIRRGNFSLGECSIELRMYLENHTYLESEHVVNLK